MIRVPSRAELTIIKHVARQVLASGMTEREIAKKAGWHEKKVRRLLTGDTELGAVEMSALARVLRRPVGELFPPVQRRAA
jgi:predicted transcriptional regulator